MKSCAKIRSLALSGPVASRLVELGGEKRPITGPGPGARTCRNVRSRVSVFHRTPSMRAAKTADTTRSSGRLPRWIRVGSGSGFQPLEADGSVYS